MTDFYHNPQVPPDFGVDSAAAPDLDKANTYFEVRTETLLYYYCHTTGNYGAIRLRTPPEAWHPPLPSLPSWARMVRSDIKRRRRTNFKQYEAFGDFGLRSHFECWDLLLHTYRRDPTAFHAQMRTLDKPATQTQTQTSKGTITMNTKEIITIMQLESGAKVVRAQYNNGVPTEAGLQGGYCFKNVLGLDLKEGDQIVCETRDTFELLTVTNPDVMATDVGCDLADLKHVVAKVENDAFLKVKEQEVEAHRKLAMSEVTSRLDTYRRQVSEGTFKAVAGLLGAESVAEDAEVVE